MMLFENISNSYYILAVLFIFGTIMGSFLNVCIYRIPNGLSIVYPPSYCPKCDKRIKPYDLLPIVSYLLLGGKCRNCKEPISWRYPFVEALTGITFVISALVYGLGLNFICSLILELALIVISFVDIDEGIILDIMLLPIIIAGVIIAVFDSSITWKYAFYGALAGGGVIGLIYASSLLLLKREGMGLGDLKLMMAAGLMLGWQRVILAFFIAVCIGALSGIIAIIYKKKEMSSEMPFGPYLAVGISVAWWFGDSIIQWYLSLI